MYYRGSFLATLSGIMRGRDQGRDQVLHLTLPPEISTIHYYTVVIEIFTPSPISFSNQYTINQSG